MSKKTNLDLFQRKTVYMYAGYVCILFTVYKKKLSDLAGFTREFSTTFGP